MRKNGYDLYRCTGCGLVMTDLGEDYPRFLSSFYTEGYFNGAPEAGAYKNYGHDKACIQKNLMPILSRIKKDNPHGRILDVGSAYGFFVELALSHGLDAWGIEPSAYALTQASESVGKRMIQTTVEPKLFPEKSFDTITLFDVVEHLADPKKDLQILRGYLKDDGMMVIATGDAGSLMARLLGRRWTFYIPPQHLYFFSKATIWELLYQSGLEPVSRFRIGKWLRISYILHLASTGGESTLSSFVTRVLHGSFLENFPLYLPMGDNMVIFARKKHT